MLTPGGQLSLFANTKRRPFAAASRSWTYISSSLSVQFKRNTGSIPPMIATSSGKTVKASLIVCGGAVFPEYESLGRTFK